MSDAGKSGEGDAGQGGAGDGKKGAGDGGAGGQPTDVQKAIDAVVARERARADKQIGELTSRFEGQVAELQSQLEAAGKKGKGADDDAYKAAVEKARKPVEDALAAEQAKLKALHGKITRAELKSEAADASVDPDAVADLLDGRVRMTDAGELEVVGRDGKPEYGAKGPKSVKELVGELLTQKPYLAKAKARDGIDFGQGDRKTGTGKTADELRAEIADLEAKGKHNDALRVQVELHRLIGVHKTKPQ